MTRSRQQLAEARQAYETYWQSYFANDAAAYGSVVDEDFTMIGTSEDEGCRNKSEALEYLRSQSEEIGGKAVLKNRSVEERQVDGLVLISETADIYIQHNADWRFYAKFRVTAFLHETPEGWKLIQLHGSVPDAWVQEGQTLAIEQIEAENQRLKEAVKRQTVELQAKYREMEIEAALEKVRSCALAMQKSDEIQEVAVSIHDRLKELSVDFYTANIYILTEGSTDIIWWLTNREHQRYPRVQVRDADIPYIRDLREAREHGINFFSRFYPLEEKNALFRYLFEETDFRKAPEEQKKFLFGAPFCAISVALSNHTGLHVTSYSRKSFTDEENEIIKRFAKVFDQAYTRFLDLQKAEAQAKEAQIEAALERVRSRSMAMQKSVELKELVSTVGTEIAKLDVIFRRVSICIFDPDTLGATWWMSNLESGESFGLFIKYHEHRPYLEHIKAWRDRKATWLYVLKGKDKIEWDKFLFTETDLSLLPDQVKESMRGKTQVHLSCSFSNFGYLVLETLAPLSDGQFDILSRFSKTFDQSYTRFRDLQHAEAQAREAQIQLALERVRARTMAMQRSDELKEVIRVVYQQLIDLKIHLDHAGFVVDYIPNGAWTFWIADEQDIPSKISHPYFESVWATQFNKAKGEGADFFVTHLNFEEKNKFYHELLSYIPDLPQASKDFYLSCPGLAATTALFDHVSLYIENFAGIPYADEENKILVRFGKVFEQTYTRFLDLQKAEEQAREAQIEAALERVRARTMGMHQSHELHEVVSVVFEQLQHLGFASMGCGVVLYDEQDLSMECWMVDPGGTIPESFMLAYFDHPYYKQELEAWQSGTPYVAIVYEGELKKSYDEHVLNHGPFAHLPDDVRSQLAIPESTVGCLAFMKYGSVGVIGPEPLSDEHAGVLQRFARVFEQAYTRFLDLQKAEAQAREGQIQLALERVRAKTMAMQTSRELPEAANLLFQQVQSLGMPAWSAGYCIWDNDDKTSVTLWMSSEGVLQPPFKLSTMTDELCIEMRKGAEQGKSFHVVEMGGKKLEAHYQYMRQQPVVGEVLDSIIAAGHPLPTFQIMHHAYFSKGYLLFITYEPLPESHEIFRRFGNVFEQTYTRFLDLQKAEAQAREAQIEASLERIRSRTMGMQRTIELKEIVGLLYEECSKFGFASVLIILNTRRDEDDGFIWWFSANEQTVLPQSYFIPDLDEPVLRDIKSIWESGKPDGYIQMGGNLKAEHDRRLFSETGLRELPNHLKEMMLSYESVFLSIANMKNGFIEVAANAFISEDQMNILQRYARVFEQTYSRFLDLQKAEAQAREAQIEAALEKVRSRTMGMQKSEELSEAATVLFQQIIALDLKPVACAFIIVDEKHKTGQVYISADGTVIPDSFVLPYHGEPAQDRIFESWKRREPYIIVDLSGQELQTHLQFIAGNMAVGEMLEASGEAQPGRLALHIIHFRHGFLGINYLEPNEAAIPLLQRFAKVFEQTYTRFLDLQNAEAQVREAKIEASLEKVRSRTMAMHRGDELADTAMLLFEQLVSLGFKPRACGFLIMDEESQTMEDWGANLDEHGKGSLITGTLAFDQHPILSQVVETWRRGDPYFIGGIEDPEELKSYYEEVTSRESAMENIIEKVLAAATSEWTNSFNFEYGMMYVLTPDPITDEEIKIMMRFAGVFKGTYTRFLDLQKAEAQAREAEIEAALERVRAQTMAMNKSEDLEQSVAIIFRELDKLKLETIRCGIGIINRAKRTADVWTTTLTAEGYDVNVSGNESMDIHPVLQGAYEAWLTQKDFSYTFDEADLLRYHKALADVDFRLPEDRKGSDLQQYYYATFFPAGGLYAFREDPFDEEIISVMRRFANAFNLAYRRFEDLRQAEAQAREAQIEASLERVRARTMAMHRTIELNEVIGVIFEELKKMGFDNSLCSIGIYNKETKGADWWSYIEGAELPGSYHFPYLNGRWFKEVYDAWVQKKPYHYIELQGDERDEQDRLSFEQTDWKFLSEELKNSLREISTDAIKASYISMNCGMLEIVMDSPLTEEQIKMLGRFARVIDLTYTRVDDLQKAERQARESKIEAALEKVRGKALAMHRSDDLLETAHEIFIVLRELGIAPIRSGLSVVTDPESMGWEAWSITEGADGKLIPLSARFTSAVHSVSETIFQHWKAQDPYWQITLSGDSLKDFVNSMPREYVPIHALWDQFIAEKKSVIFHYFSFPEGVVFAGALHSFSEDEVDIMQRFTRVFDFAYTRYQDLQKAELQATEAIKQSALDRVRAEIASMRTTKDLERITPLIWQELGALNIPFIRCGVFIIDEAQQMVESYLSTPDGRALARLHLPFDANLVTSETVDHWRRKVVYRKHWNKDEFQEWTRSILDTGQIQTVEEYQGSITPPESLDLHFVPFAQGMLYVGNTEPLSDEQVMLVKALADAFSTAYARYEDFTHLEKAKQSVELTLTELRAAQAQLIQSEKMASLGELTAGIAHEIQNPLNFVNNFSEVNAELIAEMKEEFDKGNYDEAKAILENLIENEQKIVLHGKRADGIVKSMLHHSRISTGKKEPTDLNALADEYLRLAYHGLRAKDKSFNAQFSTDLDPTLPKIEVVPQDIGRVLLNLINNAFYACNERQNRLRQQASSVEDGDSQSGVRSQESGVDRPLSGAIINHPSSITHVSEVAKGEQRMANGDSYQPLVTISTKHLGDRIEIRVKDNGNGIPESIKDKIFQPFFTTKPTGQGTGLGLSLSYDIIKTHNGELKVETKGSEGTTFTVQLPASEK